MTNELAEYLTAHDEPWEAADETEGPFHLLDDKMALWAVRKLRARTERLDEIRALADAEIAKIEEWVEETSRPIAKDADYFINLLEDYALRERAESFDERKTVSLPGATIRTTYRAPRASLVDAEVFVAWAQENKRDDLLTVKPAPAKLSSAFEVKDNVVIDFHGEVVPGVAPLPESITASVKLQKETGDE